MCHTIYSKIEFHHLSIVKIVGQVTFKQLFACVILTRWTFGREDVEDFFRSSIIHLPTSYTVPQEEIVNLGVQKFSLINRVVT